jgi:polysaccharide biosynthesis protein PslH
MAAARHAACLVIVPAPELVAAMRVLYLTPGVPADGIVGGPMGSLYNILQFARAGHDVTALCLVPKDCPDTEAREASRLATVRVVRGAGSKSPASYAANLLDPLPWPIRRYASSDYRRMIRGAFGDGDFDLVLFNSLHSATALPLVRKLTRAPCVLFQHNVQTTIMRLFASVQRNPLGRAYAELQWRKMLTFERRALGWFDLVLTFSEVDRRDLAALCPGTAIRSVPLKLDLTRFAPGAGPADDPSDVLFVAYFGWAPNEDSLRWFIEDIFPLLLARRPGTTLDIVGAGAPDWVRALDGRDGAIRFRGRVDDVAPYYRGARVVVVPLRIGSGVRVKIVQAMAAKAAIVTTAKGCEGLDVRSGEHLVVADSPGEFAAATACLLDDPARRRRLGEQARALALAQHDAHSADRPIVRECEELVRRSRTGRP